MKNKSFTLIELLVVIVIIGILAGVIIVSTVSSISKANVAKSSVFASSLKNNLIVDLVSDWHYDDYFISGSKYYTTDSQGGNRGILGVTDCSPGVDACPTFYDKDSNKCIKNGCFYFDGVDDLIYYQTGAYPNPGSVTIVGWVNVSKTLSSAHIFGKAWADGTGLMIKSGKVAFSIYSTSGQPYYYSSDKALSLNEWHFIGGSYDSRTKEIKVFSDTEVYIPNPQNNEEVREMSYYLITGRSSNASVNYSLFNGYIDELAYFSSVLTSSEVRSIYVGGLDSLLESGSISYKDYNERMADLADIDF